MNDIRLAWLDMPEEEAIEALQNSIYPGQPASSIKMVLAYCRAAQLDPFQKPVHLVPMSNKVVDANGREKWIKINTVMPGIGLYRVQAARTGAYAGQDEPVFGPMAELTYDKRISKWEGNGPDRRETVTWEKGATMMFPEWVKVTVYRVVAGLRCPFVAIEYWMENYATASKDTIAPNEMWGRRTRGQLVKCAEAQALRKGFPEVGAQPTAEEMMGRIRDDDTIDMEPAEPRTPPQRASAVTHQPADPIEHPAAAEKVSVATAPAVAPKAAPVSAPNGAEAPGWADEDAGLSGSAPTPAKAPAPAPAPAPATSEPMAQPGQIAWVKGKLQSYKVLPEQQRELLQRAGLPHDDLGIIDRLSLGQWNALKTEMMKL